MILELHEAGVKGSREPIRYKFAKDWRRYLELLRYCGMIVHYALLGHTECEDLDESTAKERHCH